MRALLLLLLSAPGFGAAPALPEPLELLRRAAQPEVTTYQGTLRVETMSPGKMVVRTVKLLYQAPGSYRREVLDESGQVVSLAVCDGEREWVYDPRRNKVFEGEAVEAALKQLDLDDELELIESNYSLSVATAAAVAGRSCWRLDLRSKADQRLRRRLWIDRRTALILASANFGPDESLLSSSRFEKLSLARRQRKSFSFVAPPGAAVVKRLEPDFLALDEVKGAFGLEPKTPSWLPAGFVFESLDVIKRGAGSIIHYRFSDGVNALSLFQCGPGLTLDFGGKTAASVGVGARKGRLAWTAEGQALSWSRGKTKFLLVGLVGSQTLQRIAESVR